jgi:hypothetical protein
MVTGLYVVSTVFVAPVAGCEDTSSTGTVYKSE